MAGTTQASWWQYSRWVYVIGRSLLINPATAGAENSAVETFIGRFVNPSTGTRPWLCERARVKCIWLQAGTEPIASTQPKWSEAKMVMLIGRDLKKIPLTTTEKTYVDTLIAATGTRRYGKKGGSI